MNGDQIRDSFIKFFQSRGHQHMPSASLVPAGDPTLLFTSAGMVPFKPFFMGEQTPPSRRLTSSQKSFRTTDIDEVGDHKHLTFFEMLGNFSIGDYFKEGAVDFAWELVTQSFKLSPDRLFVTIHLDDDEAYEIWRNRIGVPEERIYRYGDKDNWWGPAGTEGPTGPCSEIHYDGGEEKGCGPMVEVDVLTNLLREERDGAAPRPVPGCHPNCDCERFVELWNLVFMQFYQDPERNRTPLPAPSVDTGMGLERAAVILQDKNNIYETDLFEPIIARVSALSGRVYGEDADTDFAMRVVAEHARAASFLIGDGVVPGNEGRGYVLRRVIRRGIRYGRQLGLTGAFLSDVAGEVIPGFQATYPELSQNRDFILRVVNLEEERFAEAFGRGSEILDQIIERQGADDPVLSGRDTFVLYDTYGFPPELSAEIAREHGVEVDMEGFEQEMEAQRQQSRAAQAFTGSMEMLTAYENLGAGASEFVGYAHTESESVVAAILAAPSTGGERPEPVAHASQGQRVEVVISQSPFYPEGGGQLGDQGYIHGPNGLLSVEDTQRPVAGLIVQSGVVEQGEIAVGDPVRATVDPARRLDSSRNHSGTHILHAALRSVLGPHVRQAGSFVAPERLRFDFSHVSQLTRDELLAVQSLSNNQVRANLAVSFHETSFSEAVRQGALAFFGDRYGDVVRIVTMAEKNDHGGHPFSMEVCGGTHVSATGQVGTLMVLGESSIGGGMRRIEALTGRSAEELFVEQSGRLERLAHRLQTPVLDLETRLDAFMEETDELRRRLADLERSSLRAEAEVLLQRAVDIDGAMVVVGRTSSSNADGMRQMGDFIRDKLSSAVVVLGAVTNGAPVLVAMVTPDLVERGVNAGNIARDTAKIMGGGGGGRPDMAQAGGKQPEKLDEALNGVAGLVRGSLT